MEDEALMDVVEEPMDDDVDADHDSEFEDVDDDEGIDDDDGETPSSSSKDPKKKKTTKVKKPKAYLPGMQMKDGETLTCDETAYITLHTFTTAAPCLSFDIIPDNVGDDRKFPLTCYAVAGTQAQRSHANNVVVMKMSNVYKTQPKSSDDELSSDESEDEGNEEELTKKPELTAALVPHHGCINRLRFRFFDAKPLAATWSELGKVSIWDLTVPLRVLDNVQQLQDYIKQKDKPKPLFTFKGHRGEGFAMDWSPTMPGVLATGDCTKFIHVWNPQESSWNVDQRPFTGHTESVEDIQWSPTEPHVFASCSVDKSIRIWDSRAKPNKANMLTKENAHEKDVNVISWNRKDPFLASGGDDCALKIWDLRTFTSGESVAEFKHHHKAPVCSVEWSPHESTVLCSAGEDDQVAIWDLALERDTEEAAADTEEVNLPAQLLFIHQGQQDIKEVHWHTQIPGVLISTSASGFNVFKPANV